MNTRDTPDESNASDGCTCGGDSFRVEEDELLELNNEAVTPQSSHSLRLTASNNTTQQTPPTPAWPSEPDQTYKPNQRLLCLFIYLFHYLFTQHPLETGSSWSAEKFLKLQFREKSKVPGTGLWAVCRVTLMVFLLIQLEINAVCIGLYNPVTTFYTNTQHDTIFSSQMTSWLICLSPSSTHTHTHNLSDQFAYPTTTQTYF